MLAMERLPPMSQPFSTALPLPSPTLQSPRSASLAPPFCMHGSPVMHPAAALHVSLPPGPYSSMKQQQLVATGSLVYPAHPSQSSSNLSTVQTPPPYDHPSASLLSLHSGVFSPTGAQQTSGLSILSPDHDHHHGHPAPAPGDSPRLCPPTSISIPHLGPLIASSSASSNSTEGSSGSPPGTFVIVKYRRGARVV